MTSHWSIHYLVIPLLSKCNVLNPIYNGPTVENERKRQSTFNCLGSTNIILFMLTWMLFICALQAIFHIVAFFSVASFILYVKKDVMDDCLNNNIQSQKSLRSTIVYHTVDFEITTELYVIIILWSLIRLVCSFYRVIRVLTSLQTMCQHK